MFTKRHFEAIAAILSDARLYGEEFVTTDEAIDRLTRVFADLFAESNPRFDRARFLTAAGVEH